MVEVRGVARSVPGRHRTEFDRWLDVMAWRLVMLMFAILAEDDVPRETRS